MRKIISFSLWGAHRKYCVGAIKNVPLARKFYPDWQCRFYVDLGVPISVISQLEEMGAEIVTVQEFGSFTGMFWRFWALEDSDIVLVRDADSRISEREKILVEKWLSSDKTIMTIHDHPYHRASFMPGLSGFKRGAIVNITQKIDKFLDNREGSSDNYGIDYEFFHELMPSIQDKVLLYDSIFMRGTKIDLPREGLEFCGSVFDENEQRMKAHDNVLEEWLKAQPSNKGF